MAGYAIGFEDGGEPEDESAGLDTSAPQQDQGIPDEPEDESAGLDKNPRSHGATDEEGYSHRAGIPAPHQMLRKIVAYLTGAGSVPPQVAEQATQGIKANDPTISDDDANLMAVHEAAQKGGPAAAWAMLQYNRTSYNAKQTFAKAALNGVDGKAGDISAAAQAATQAGAHVLDGSSAVFTAAPGGVTATVKGSDGQAQQYRLTPQQFNEYLDTGKQGQWDRMMQDGIGGSLQKVSQTTQANQGGQPQGTTPAASTPPATKPRYADTYEDDDQGGDDQHIPQERNNYGETPSTMDLSGGQPLGGYTQKNAYSDELQQRANERFPSASQGDQRAAWLDAQANQASAGRRKLREAEAVGESRIEAARQTGAGKVAAADTAGSHRENIAASQNQSKENVAGTNAGARVQSAQIRADAMSAQQKAKVEQELQHQARIARSAEERNAASLLRAKIANSAFEKLTPDENARITQMIGGGGQQAAQPQAQAQPQARQPSGNQQPVTVQSPADAQKLTPGTVYMTPDGRKFTR